MQINSLIRDNVDNNGTDYYFPAYLSICSSRLSELNVLGFPSLLGLSHEPHVLFLLLGPGFFLLLNEFKDKAVLSVLLYASILIMFPIATSVTAILVFIVLFIIEQLYVVFIKKNKKSFITFILVVGVLGLILFLNQDIISSVYEIVDAKASMDSDEGSKRVSVSMLKYIISPKTLIGLGNMPPGYGVALERENIGFITCVLDLIFFIMIIRKTFVNIFQKDSTIHYFGMSVLYFILHTMKMGVMTFSYPMISFFVVILVVLEQERHRVFNIKK